MKYRAIKLGRGKFGVVSVSEDGVEVTLPVRGTSRREALMAAAKLIRNLDRKVNTSQQVPGTPELSGQGVSGTQRAG